jgi:probable F420-dependent oxidoreductase
MSRIRVAIQIHPQHGTFRAMRAAVAAADDIGFDAVYTWDHFFPLYGDRSGAHFECWSLLAAWAEVTEHVELGPLVTCAGYRNADLLADMARTVDHICSGRLVFGIGAGWFERDYVEYGFPFESAGRRLDRLEDTLVRVTARWDRLNPPPVRRPPVLIGGVGERRTLRLVARYADVWHAMFPERPEEIAHLNDVLDAHCRTEGRDPASIVRAIGVEPEDLERMLAEDADAYVGLGVTSFTLGVNGPDYDLTPTHDWLAWRNEHDPT